MASKLTKTLQFELEQYSDKVNALQEENKRLHKLLSALTAYKNGSSVPQELVQHFQTELNFISDSINKRAKKISDLETKIKSTRVINGYDFTIHGEKVRLLDQNSHLIDLAFHQEKISITEHSKLKISHDLRRLNEYKNYVQDLINGKSIDFDNEEIQNKKRQIENLRNAIRYEKSRILSMQTPQFQINEAATIIQKNWRGFNQRFRAAKQKIDEINKKSINFDETDEVFNVTGVFNAQETVDDDGNTPADAFNVHNSNKLNESNEKSPKKYKKSNDFGHKNASKQRKERKVDSFYAHKIEIPHIARFSMTVGSKNKSPLNYKTCMSD